MFRRYIANRPRRREMSTHRCLSRCALRHSEAEVVVQPFSQLGEAATEGARLR